MTIRVLVDWNWLYLYWDQGYTSSDRGWQRQLECVFLQQGHRQQSMHRQLIPKDFPEGWGS